MNNRKPIVGISIGDANGIGPEIIIKCFISPQIFKQCTPVVYGSSKIISYHKKALGLEDFRTNQIKPGQKPKENTVNIYSFMFGASRKKTGCSTVNPKFCTGEK